ncbi:MAG: DegT/DnrJ/EryC1/StrS family aminotransferase, partial [Gaiellaceae bacterium]
YPTKNLGALGDGGAVVTVHDDVAERARLLRSYGEARRYESVITGTNSRLDTLQAALLSVQLRHLEEWTARRRAIAREYTAALGETGLVLPVDDAGHAYHLYVVRSSERGAFRERLSALGVETLVHYPRAVHQHPAYAEIARGSSLRVSERLVDEVVSLPLYPELTDGEVQTVVTAVRSAA